MTGVNHFQSLTDQPIKLEISLKISWRSSQLECKTESARIEAYFSLYTPLLPLTMCTLYLSKNHSHIHVSDIVRGSGSVHVGKKTLCRDYVHLAKTWRSQDYVCPPPPPLSKNEAFAIVCAGTVLKVFEKCFRSKTMRLKQGVSRGILSNTYTNH